MKEYYVKIGNLYVHDIYTSFEELSTYFLKEIELTTCSESGFRVKEEDQDTFADILEKVFDVSNIYDIISFEEVKEEG